VSTWSQITWDVARTGGFTAYVLLWASVALGLVLSLQWRNPAWPRFVTNEVHRYVSLLALVFTGVHTLGVFLDPFMAFTPGEVLVPMLSHYRPIWMALGIVGAYLLIALWLSEYLRPFVGYRAWRLLHYLSFAAFALALAHGITTGSDTRTAWATLLYAGTGASVLGLLTVRLLMPSLGGRHHPAVATFGMFGLVFALFLLAQGPFHPGWNAVANNGNGSGARVALPAADLATATPVPTPSPLVAFNALFSGSLQQSPVRSDGTLIVTVDGRLSGGATGTLRLQLEEQVGSGDEVRVVGTQLTLSAAAGVTACQGGVTGARGQLITATCVDPAGQPLQVVMTLSTNDQGQVQGNVSGQPISG
jgi:Ferric reductase like transmembrane component